VTTHHSPRDAMRVFAKIFKNLFIVSQLSSLKNPFNIIKWNYFLMAFFE